MLHVSRLFQRWHIYCPCFSIIWWSTNSIQYWYFKISKIPVWSCNISVQNPAMAVISYHVKCISVFLFPSVNWPRLYCHPSPTLNFNFGQICLYPGIVHTVFAHAFPISWTPLSLALCLLKSASFLHSLASLSSPDILLQLLQKLEELHSWEWLTSFLQFSSRWLSISFTYFTLFITTKI